MKLLVVDDSDMIRARLVGWLRGSAGVDEIRTATTLIEALRCVTQAHPALTILDLQLPDGSALDILPALKALAPDMHIAMLSNDASEYSRVKCQQAGADWFFDKSTEFEQLLALVQQQAALH